MEAMTEGKTFQDFKSVKAGDVFRCVLATYYTKGFSKGFEYTVDEDLFLEGCKTTSSKFTLVQRNGIRVGDYVTWGTQVAAYPVVELGDYTFTISGDGYNLLSGYDTKITGRDLGYGVENLKVVPAPAPTIKEVYQDLSPVPEPDEEDTSFDVVSDPVADLVSTREETHGEFKNNAAIAQGIKELLREYTSEKDYGAILWYKLDDFQKDALDMIAAKIGRILAGDPNHKDHWDDIAGYARLVSDRL